MTARKIAVIRLTDGRLVDVTLTAADAPPVASAADPGEQPTHWVAEAACRQVDAPSMFADHWGVGADARRRRAAALRTCRKCPVRQACGLSALAAVDAGFSLYGVLCGVAFTDVTPSRQWRDVARLRAVVASLDGPASAGSGQTVRVRIRPAAPTPAPPPPAELGRST